MRFLSSLILFFTIISCSQPELSRSEVFSEAIFTGGIEGPAYGKDGNLYVVNCQREGTVGVLDAKSGKLIRIIDLPEGSIGNGIRLDENGDLLLADYKKHNILQYSFANDSVRIYAHSDLMHQPNDIARMQNGILFASDPNWKEEAGQLWKVTKDSVVLVESDMGTTNGLEVGAGDSILYVNESIQKRIWKYSLNSNGDISNKTLFYEFSDAGLDGMRCDVKGNLYVARYDAGEVVIISPKGELLKTVQLNGRKPTNITFGGEKNSVCFVTIQDKKWIEKFSALNPGRE